MICLRCRCGFNPWVGKIPLEKGIHPLQYSCLENSTDRGAWWIVFRRVIHNWEINTFTSEGIKQHRNWSICEGSRRKEKGKCLEKMFPVPLVMGINVNLGMKVGTTMLSFAGLPWPTLGGPFHSSRFSGIKKHQYHGNIQFIFGEGQIISVLKWHVNCVCILMSTLNLH